MVQFSPKPNKDACIKGPYRYWLTRDPSISGKTTSADVNPSDPKDMIFIGLNPSTADAHKDDPTIERCIGFAQKFKCQRLIVLNLFAYRATDPADMIQALNPIGPENDDYIRCICTTNSDREQLIIVGWGCDGKHQDRDQQVLKVLEPVQGKVYCLKKNQDGTPTHPLYLSGNCELIPYPQSTKQ